MELYHASKEIVQYPEIRKAKYVSASKEGVVLFPPPIDILGKTNIF